MLLRPTAPFIYFNFSDHAFLITQLTFVRISITNTIIIILLSYWQGEIKKLAGQAKNILASARDILYERRYS